MYELLGTCLQFPWDRSLTWRATAVLTVVLELYQCFWLANCIIDFYFWLKNLLYLSVVHVITARLLMQYRTV